VVTVKAGLDEQGKIIAWDFMDRSLPWSEAVGNPMLASRQLGHKTAIAGGRNGRQHGGELYNFENKKVVISALVPWKQEDPSPLRTSNLRAPGSLARAVVSEGMIDRIAAHLGADPVEFRLGYLTHEKRATEALRAAAEKAGWKPRPPRAGRAGGAKASGRGVSVSDHSNSVVAVVAEVDVDRTTGKVSVTRLVAAHDCGLIVNPDGLKNQIEGNLLQAVSRLLLEEVRFDASSIRTLDWRSYPVLRFQDVPEIEIVLINRPEMPPSGAGEPSIAPAAAAVANAIFDAVGVQLEEAPFTPERMLRALKTA
jgi:CO/xanthine dehydrogenase Mo-binding subunit